MPLKKTGTGGGILVPIFINAIPVPLAQDAYPIAIAVSFTLHSYFPILKDILALSPFFQVFMHHSKAIELSDLFGHFSYAQWFLFGTLLLTCPFRRLKHQLRQLGIFISTGRRHFSV
jgi:hypothetical protein